VSRPLERRVEGDVAGLTWPVLEDGGVSAVVTERGGGVSTGPYASLNLGLHVGDDPAAVVENRRRAAALVGAGLDDLVFCNQTHGREVVVVTNADRGRGARTVDDAIPGADVDRVLLPDDTDDADDRWRFDLWTGNELLLWAAGIPAEHVSRAAALPTGGDRFFSDRAVRPCGRFAAIARLHR